MHACSKQVYMQLACSSKMSSFAPLKLVSDPSFYEKWAMHVCFGSAAAMAISYWDHLMHLIPIKLKLDSRNIALKKEMVVSKCYSIDMTLWGFEIGIQESRLHCNKVSFGIRILLVDACCKTSIQVFLSQYLYFPHLNFIHFLVTQYSCQYLLPVLHIYTIIPR